MSEHTPTPWNAASAYSSVCGVPIINSKGQRVGNTALTDLPMEFDEMKQRAVADAALIVKAVNSHDALLAFFHWAMREGPFDGCDLDGASIQEKAEGLGLIVKTKYEAEKHGPAADWMFQDGDDWYEFAPHLRTDLISEKVT